ncbi:MAG TPA: AI-2E family transporter [Flavisolibacter sp.]|jgi:predicted PurR-regulated permease PerM|nr:AI-2E family transporter [Flavisolibacter sp.]
MMTNKETSGYVLKVWIAGGILALIVILVLLIKATFSVWLLVLAGALIAIYFTGLSGLIQQKTSWSHGACLALSVTSTLLLLVLTGWLIGTKVQEQATQLRDTLPRTIENAKHQLSSSSFGSMVVEKISSPKAQQKAQSLMATMFRSTFGVLGDLYVVLFLGIFFTVAPGLYKKGMVKLVPQKNRTKADELLQKTGTNLKKWLKGKLFAMLVVMILTAIGLSLMKMPMWLVLALLAGLLNFIPNFGPLIALIPALLVALMQGPSTAAWVAGLYILVQVAESNFITPMVQKKLVSIPPALIIIAQMLMAPLTGGWGLVLATPLMLIVMTLVQELYIAPQEAKS